MWEQSRKVIAEGLQFVLLISWQAQLLAFGFLPLRGSFSSVLIISYASEQVLGHTIHIPLSLNIPMHADKLSIANTCIPSAESVI